MQLRNMELFISDLCPGENDCFSVGYGAKLGCESLSKGFFLFFSGVNYLCLEPSLLKVKKGHSWAMQELFNRITFLL